MLTGVLDGDRENEEPQLLAKHIAALIKASPRSQIMVFVERNLDDTRPVRVREKTVRFLRQMGVDPRHVHFARSPYKNKPDDRGIGVHTDHNIKCWSVHHVTELMRDNRVVIWRDLVHINEHHDRPKLATLKNYLENLEWVPIKGKSLVSQVGQLSQGENPTKVAHQVSSPPRTTRTRLPRARTTGRTTWPWPWYLQRCGWPWPTPVPQSKCSIS